MVSAWLGLVARECAGAEGFAGREAGRPVLWGGPAAFHWSGARAGCGPSLDLSALSQVVMGRGLGLLGHTDAYRCLLALL